MDWPSWNQAIAAAVVSFAVAAVLARLKPTTVGAALRPALIEFSLVASLYAVWRLARTVPLANVAGAIERARRLDQLQHRFGLPTELSLQRFVLSHDWLAHFSNSYYAIAHVPALVGFLIWLFVRHRDRYPRWRNGLVILTGFCLLIRFQRVAPPRFLADLGYVDLAERFGMSLYGPVGTGVSDQFAAMPSIHVGWAAVVSLGIVAASTSRWRGLYLVHLILTMLVVSATGNHWWLDGIVAIALLGLAFAIDAGVRKFGRRMQCRNPRSIGDS